MINAFSIFTMVSPVSPQVLFWRSLFWVRKWRVIQVDHGHYFAYVRSPSGSDLMNRYETWQIWRNLYPNKDHNIIWLWNIFGFEGFVFRDSFAYQKDFLQIISKMYNIEMIVPWSEKKNIGCISCQRFKALVLFGIPASIPFQRPETSSTGEV